MPFEVIPSEDLKVIDLVRDAGLDVSDWANFKGRNPATNPRYCYEWAFKGDDGVVLNLWYDETAHRDGAWIQDLSPRKWGRGADGTPLRTNWQVRAKRFEDAIEFSYKRGLPLRVIICAGTRRKIGDASAQSSSVKKRILDPAPWAVTHYNPATGDCLLTRGYPPDPFGDQFSDEEDLAPEKRDFSGSQFIRRPEVRRKVRVRADGRCEFCQTKGFKMENGKIYIETHHVIPLHEGGPDTEQNVVALCANHHREAHFADTRLAMRERLTAHLKSIY